MEKIKNKVGRKPGQRPDMWKSGPDPRIHEYFRVFLQHRNQANWRQESYELSWEQWFEIWADKIEQRGRKSGQYYMTRIDNDLSWNKDNVRIKQR